MDQRLQQEQRVAAGLGLRRRGVGLGNVKDLLDIEDHAAGAVLVLEFPARLQEHDGLAALLHLCAPFLPFLKGGKPGGLRALRRQQEGVGYAVAVEPRLHVQILRVNRLAGGGRLGGLVGDSEALSPLALLLLLVGGFVVGLQPGLPGLPGTFLLCRGQNVVKVFVHLDLSFLFILGARCSVLMGSFLLRPVRC